MSCKGRGIFFSRAEYLKAYYAAIPHRSRDYYRANRKRVIARTTKWRKDNPDKTYLYHLRGKFGLEPEVYADMVRRQKNKCAICGGTDKRKLCVDHCHKTNKVRKLLCDRCNRMLGICEENIEVLNNAIDYLRTN